RPGLDVNAALPNGDREHVHRPRGGAGEDLPVTVVDRPVAGTVETARRLDGVLGPVALTPGHRAAQMGALLPEGQEAFGDAREVELALGHLRHLPNLEVADVACQHGAAE